MTENDFDETVITCGDCEFWMEMKTEEDPPAAANESFGRCYCRPPQVFPAQQQNALGQVQMGFINVRPALDSNERACGDFEPRDPPKLSS